MNKIIICSNNKKYKLISIWREEGAGSRYVEVDERGVDEELQV